MSPRRSKTSVLPSGETSTDIHVPSRASNSTTRASGRGVLMSAAGSFFAAGDAAGFGARGAAETRPAPTKTATGRMDFFTRPPGKGESIRPEETSALAEELLEQGAALRPLAVEGGQLRERLRMARLSLHRLAVHGLGAALEL